jgi:large subunit ribosomal protein L4
MKLSVYNIQGEKTDAQVELNESVFGIEANDHAIYLAVKQYMANSRQGTHAAKERGDITGSTKKVKKQKGTGTARMGSLKSPLLRGGGRVFGPRPRNYSFKLNKKLKRLAVKSALSYKVKEENIIVVDNINFDDHKTKSFVNFQKSFDIVDKKSLIVLSEQNKNVYLSSRNVQGTKLSSVNQLFTYELLDAKKLILTKESVEFLNNNLG